MVRILRALADRRLYGNTDQDSMIGTAGNDTMYGGGGHDSLFGGNGNDVLFGDAGNDLLDGGLGNDLLRGGAENDTVLGGAGNDTLQGEAGVDSILGGDGADVLDGGDGNDFLSGEAGNDSVRGGAGNDFAFTGDGNDVVFGGSGNDTLRTGFGDDRLAGDEGDDMLCAAWGNDSVLGMDGNDVIWGGQGNDHLKGGDGNDLIIGGDGNDLLAGCYGADFLLSRSDGGRPGDTAAPSGNDTLDGGPSPDTFRFELLLNAGTEVLNRNLNADGTIDWTRVAAENGSRQAHWVESIGNDWIQNFSTLEGDVLEIFGRGVEVASISYRDLTADGRQESIIVLRASSAHAANAGDALGTITVKNATVRMEHIEIEDMILGAYNLPSEGPLPLDRFGVMPTGWEGHSDWVG